MRLHSRLNKLESIKKVNAVMELFDNQGNKVDAIIQKMPTKDIGGLAKLPDGSIRGIHCLVSVADVILSLPEHQVESKDVDTTKDTLFLRVNNTRCGAEILLGCKV